MKNLFILLICLSLTACATNKYVVDLKDVNVREYHVDLQECKAYRSQISTTDGVGETIVAALILGALWGTNSVDTDIALEFVTSTAIVAGAGQGIENIHTKDEIVKNCLRERGYHVLN